MNVAADIDRGTLASTLDGLSHQLRGRADEDGAAALRRLAATLALLCRVTGDTPDLGEALADSWARTDSYLLALSDAAAAFVPPSVTDGLLARARVELADQLSALASTLYEPS